MSDDRLLDSLKFNCGPLMMKHLEDPNVVEIMLNPDGRLWIERYGEAMECVGDLPVAQGKAILSLVANALGCTVDERRPIVEGVFPLDGSRFEGVFPPIVGPGASFSLRKKAARIIPLSDYVESGVMRPEVIPILREAIVGRKNIVVVGGTSSGKTTFVNAVIRELDELCPDDRLLILEDTRELQSSAPNVVFFQTTEKVGMRELAATCMRYRPTRILVGEVRDGAALELLKLWNTGHPGGIGTFHADSAEEALPRLEELVEEAGVGCKSALIGRAVDLVVFMTRTSDNTRRLQSIVRVHGYANGRYETEAVYECDAILR
ncbi:MAG TPA: P-type conjugative transfer ATPase TrbB [Candidatus Desulfovibrio intestinigallinarum]|nr:P-type conjugative transfer ATPase TrbB [Candidatus Desulfovibrio intestinigallinarum]